MDSEPHTHVDLTPVQHPIISRHSTLETILQFLIMAGMVVALEWFGVRFEITLFMLLILGFTLNTMNVMSAAISHNVHLAEIRDLLIQQADTRNHKT